jgi:orotate phosphoribosyltransferase
MRNTRPYNELADLLRHNSVKTGGRYLLASGTESTVYVDAKLTTCTARGAKLVGQAFITKFEELGWHPEAVGGLVIGADPIVMAIARQSLETGRDINAFLVRKEAKKHGLLKYIEGVEHTNGLEVVIIDDVCTTGESTVVAIERARTAGMTVLGAICLVDRQQGAEDQIAKQHHCPFASIFTLDELLTNTDGHLTTRTHEVPSQREVPVA